MTRKELNARMPGRRISQICGASRDIQRTIAAWTDLMKVGPWLILTSSPQTIANVLVNNKPLPEGADFHSFCALAMLGNAQLEFNQPLWGDEALPAFLTKNGEAWHHFKEHVAPGAEVLKTGRDYLERKGLDIVSYGEIDEDRYLNVATYGPVGVNLELGNTGRISFPPENQRNWPEGDTSALAALSRTFEVGDLTFVTDCLDKALAAWVKYIEAGPWRVVTVDETLLADAVIDGKKAAGKFSYRRATCQWGDKRITVLERGYGIPVIAEYAAQSGRGMHHLKQRVAAAEFDVRIKEFASRGIGVRFGGRLGNERFACLDTEKVLGVRVGLSDFGDATTGKETVYPKE